MPPVLRRYFIWVLLPVAVAFGIAHLLLTRALERQTLDSAANVGVVATAFFRAEMAERAAELARDAPVLTSPDPGSPVVEAAMRGDTVAALSAMPDGLGLSVALSEVVPTEEGSAPRLEDEPSRRVRGVTDLFAPRTPGLLRSRTGYATALYLRGERVLSEPPGLGPELIPPAPTGGGDDASPFPTLNTASGPGVLLPVDPTRSAPSAVHFLVVPPQTSARPLLSRPGLLLVALGLLLGFGIMAIRIGRLLKPTAPPPHTILLSATVLPVLGLWSALALAQRGMEGERAELQGGEMVRVLALLKGADPSVGLAEAVAGTGMDLTRSRGGEALESTLPSGELRERVAALQPPPPTFPTTGTLREPGKDRPFASLRTEDGSTLTLSGPGDESDLLRLRFLLATFAGVASLAGLIFLFRETRRAETG